MAISGGLIDVGVGMRSGVMYDLYLFDPAKCEVLPASIAIAWFARKRLPISRLSIILSPLSKSLAV